MSGSAYESAALRLKQELQAQRIVILGMEQGQWKVEACLGLQIRRLEDAPISLSLINEVAQSGVARIVADVQDSSLEERFSVLVGGMQSCCCLPWWAPGQALAGILYADSGSRSTFFGPRQLAGAQRVARRLEEEVFGASAPAEKVTPLMHAARPAPRAKAAPPESTPLDRPDLRVVWLRTLSVMLEAGLPLTKALQVLLDTSPPGPPQEALERALKALHRGQTLHEAMQLSGAFPRGQVQLVRCGESSGSLALVLQRLATYEERLQEHRQRLRSALFYPALVGTLALLLVTLLTPLVLQGQLEILQRSGRPLPWLTQLLLMAARHRGLLLLSALGLGVALVKFVPRLPRRYLFALPGVGRVMRSSSVWLFCETLGLLFEAGLALPECLTQSASASGDPELEAHRDGILNSVLEGRPLAEAISQNTRLPRLVCETIRAGEESGQLPTLLGHAANLARSDFETTLESWSKLLEPLLLLGMGLFVGGILIGTLAPTLQLLETL